jgi:hypothetical protein
MSDQDKLTEVVEDSVEQQRYLYVNQYGVVESTNQKYFIKD